MTQGKEGDLSLCFKENSHPVKKDGFIVPNCPYCLLKKMRFFYQNIHSRRRVYVKRKLKLNFDKY